jgi:hypothetical protein
MHTHASNAGIKLDQTPKGGHIAVGAYTFMIIGRDAYIVKI